MPEQRDIVERAEVVFCCDLGNIPDDKRFDELLWRNKLIRELIDALREARAARSRLANDVARVAIVERAAREKCRATPTCDAPMPDSPRAPAPSDAWCASCLAREWITGHVPEINASTFIGGVRCDHPNGPKNIAGSCLPCKIKRDADIASEGGDDAR